MNIIEFNFIMAKCYIRKLIRNKNIIINIKDIINIIINNCHLFKNNVQYI